MFAILVLIPLASSAQSTCPPLSLGSTGAQVTAVQHILYKAYANFPTPTGYFGSLTQAALKQWQRDHGITPVGTVGPLTAAAMKLSCTPAPTVTTPSTPVPTAPTNSAPSTSSTVSPQASSGQARTLVRGLSGTDVLLLQQFLVTQKLLAAESATGFFGAFTEAAVKQYQVQRGIASSGTPLTTGYGAVGPRTRATITDLAGTNPTQPPPVITSTKIVYTLPTITTLPQTQTPLIPTIPTSFSCMWNNQTVADGSYVIAYQSSSVASEQTCVSQTRTCTNGTLSGSYTASSCTVASPASCSFNGQGITSGASVTAYQATSVAAGQSCTSQSRTCTNGVLSGTYTNASCTVGNVVPATCTWNNATVSNGASVTAYQSSSVSFGQACTPQTRTCANGTLSGTYNAAVCTVAAAASCTFNGQSVAHGASATAYQSSSVAAGSQCVSQNRSCSNGVLSGTYTNASCSVAAAASCTWNNQSVASGASVTAYQSSSVASGQTCTQQTRTCANGTLSGTYTNASCTVAAPTQLPIVVQTSSSATGHPANNMLDGSLSTAWVASLQPVGVNNFAWIQLDLGSRRYVDAVEWTSASQPYPASVLKNYVIKVSDDGVAWTPIIAHFEPHTAAPAYVQKKSIGKNARYIRIETTKINDASGWAASIAELSIASEPQKDLSYACDITVTPSEDYSTRIGSLRGGTAERWTNVCLQPGTYTAAVRIHDAQYLRILAPSGGVTFTASVRYVAGNSAPFNIWDSHDIYIQNIKTINTHTFTTTADSTTQWSHALRIARTNNLTLENVDLVSNGKQAVYMENTTNTLINGGSIKGYYFLFSPADQNSIYTYNVTFTTDGSAQIPADEHSMHWVDAGDVVLDSSYFNMITGKGLFTGGGSPTSRLVITGVTRVSGLNAWVDNHQNYSNVHVYVTGTYPALTPFYNYAGGGNAANSFVCTYSGASAPLSATGCTYPQNSP